MQDKKILTKELSADGVTGGGPRAHLLLATNGKDRGDRAVALGAVLAKDGPCRLTVLHILDSEAPRADAEAALCQLEEKAKPCAEAAPTTLNVQAMDVYWDDEEAGRAATLQAIVDQDAADFVVMGAHDKARGSFSILGTLTDRLMKNLSVPVLIAANQTPRPYRRVVAAIDFSEFSDEVVATALKVAPNADIHLLYVHDAKSSVTLQNESRNTEAADRESQLADLIAKFEDDNEAAERLIPEIRKGEPKTIIPQTLSDLEADLLVMGTRGRSAPMRLLFGSVAKRFIDNPPCDLAVIPAGALRE